MDMNLPPSWISVLERNGYSAIHWSTIGDPGAPDSELLSWARDNNHVVFTNDLGFGAILAATLGFAPSVIQVRTQDVTPSGLEATIVVALRQHQDLLEQGAIISVDQVQSRARILPLRKSEH
ncbi:MAG: DUF5615 family PIN-like protein [Gemmatimonadota bacterium]